MRAVVACQLLLYTLSTLNRSISICFRDYNKMDRCVPKDCFALETKMLNLQTFTKTRPQYIDSKPYIFKRTNPANISKNKNLNKRF